MYKQAFRTWCKINTLLICHLYTYESDHTPSPHTPHTQLVSLYGVDRQLLPSRGVLGFFAKLKKGELMETQGVLEGMLMAVVQNCPVAPTELFKFLEYPFCVSGSFVCVCMCSLYSACSGSLKTEKNLKTLKLLPVYSTRHLYCYYVTCELKLHQNQWRI